MKSLKERALAVEAAMLADWRKSWSVFVVWSLLLALIANLGVGPLAPRTRSADAALANLSDVIQVEAGAGYGLALKSDGTVLAWGNNGNGQLGDGTTDPRLNPVQVSGLGTGSGVIAIAAGATHSLALKSDGTVLAWGDNLVGRLGDGTTTQRLTPVQVSGLGAGSGVTAIDAGFTNSLALKSDGTVLCWGRNQFGNCGDGTVVTPRLTPVTVTGSATGIVEIKALSNFGLARKADGTVVGWGLNANGQLGDGTITQRNSAVQAGGFGPGSGIVALASGGFNGAQFSMAVKSDGTVMAWGNNSSGQLGDGTTTETHAPVQVSGLGAGSGVTAVSNGSLHSIARKSDGSVMAWGSNSSGQLGDGTVTQRLTPVQVSGLGGGSDITKVASGDLHTYALKSGGTVLAWGSNSSGQLGDGTFFGRSSPVATSGLGASSGVTAISAGTSHSLALKSDGTVLAWGDNTNGRLGDGTTTQRITPVQVSGFGSGSGVTAVSAGSSHSLALKSDGTVWAWGGNANGQIGDGTTTERLTPVQVTSATGVIAIATGSSGANASYALKSDGSVLAWGLNTTSGRLGDGTTTQRLSPVIVSGLGTGTGVIAIAAGGTSACALKSDGTVMCWGQNTLFQVGDGTSTDRLVPTETSGLGAGSGVTAIAVSNQSAYAMKSNGTVMAWGSGSAGQIGDGAATNRSTPVQVTGLGSGSGVTAISAMGSSASVRMSNGTVMAWGSNTSGQLGDGSTSQRAAPVQVSGYGSGSGVTAISVGSNFHLALKSDNSVYAWGANNSGQLGDGTVYTSNLTPANVLVEAGSGSNANVAPAVQLDQPNGGEVLRAGETKLILWGGRGSQVVSARLSLSTDSGATYPDMIATTMSGSGYWLWTVPDVTTDKARVRIEFLSVEGTAYVSDASDADFTIIGSAPASSGSGGITGGEGSGTSTAIVEGTDTSASGKDALTREQANLQLPPEFPVDSLVKLPEDSAVYYLGLDGKRHPFINAAAYHSWYPNFDGVEEIGLATLVTIPLGGPILARPGTYWVKIVSDARTYYVEPGYKLRWIKDEAAAVQLGGPEWNRNIIDVDSSFFTLYATGSVIDAASLSASWPAGTEIDPALNLQDARKIDGLRYYVTGGTKRAFVPDGAFEANGFQTRFAWNHASETASIETLKALPSGPDITGPEDALFSLMH